MYQQRPANFAPPPTKLLHPPVTYLFEDLIFNLDPQLKDSLKGVELIGQIKRHAGQLCRHPLATTYNIVDIPDTIPLNLVISLSPTDPITNLVRRYGGFKGAGAGASTSERKVLRPEWIKACIAAGKIIREGGYGGWEICGAVDSRFISKGVQLPMAPSSATAPGFPQQVALSPTISKCPPPSGPRANRETSEANMATSSLPPSGPSADRVDASRNEAGPSTGFRQPAYQPRNRPAPPPPISIPPPDQGRQRSQSTEYGPVPPPTGVSDRGGSASAAYQPRGLKLKRPSPPRSESREDRHRDNGYRRAPSSAASTTPSLDKASGSDPRPSGVDSWFGKERIEGLPRRPETGGMYADSIEESRATMAAPARVEKWHSSNRGHSRSESSRSGNNFDTDDRFWKTPTKVDWLVNQFRLWADDAPPMWGFVYLKEKKNAFDWRQIYLHNIAEIHSRLPESHTLIRRPLSKIFIRMLNGKLLDFQQDVQKWEGMRPNNSFYDGRENQAGNARRSAEPPLDRSQISTPTPAPAKQVPATDHDVDVSDDDCIFSDSGSNADDAKAGVQGGGHGDEADAFLAEMSAQLPPAPQGPPAQTQESPEPPAKQVPPKAKSVFRSRTATRDASEPGLSHLKGNDSGPVIPVFKTAPGLSNGIHIAPGADNMAAPITKHHGRICPSLEASVIILPIKPGQIATSLAHQKLIKLCAGQPHKKVVSYQWGERSIAAGEMLDLKGFQLGLEERAAEGDSDSEDRLVTPNVQEPVPPVIDDGLLFSDSEDDVPLHLSRPVKKEVKSRALSSVEIELQSPRPSPKPSPKRQDASQMTDADDYIAKDYLGRKLRAWNKKGDIGTFIRSLKRGDRDWVPIFVRMREDLTRGLPWLVNQGDVGGGGARVAKRNSVGLKGSDRTKKAKTS